MRHALTLLPILASLACGPAAPKVDPNRVCAMTASLRVRTTAATYVPAAGAPDVELTLGFQGFRMLYVMVWMSEDPRSKSLGYVAITPENMSGWTQPFQDLPTTPSEGGILTDPFPLFFNDSPIQGLANHLCDLKLVVGTDHCGASDAGRVRLIYRPGCVQDADGGIVCSDGGTT